MTDLVERLRRPRWANPMGDYLGEYDMFGIEAERLEAADEIDRLRKFAAEWKDVDRVVSDLTGRAVIAEAEQEANENAWIEAHRITAGYAEREISLTQRAEAAEGVVDAVRLHCETHANNILFLHPALTVYDKERSNG